MRQVLLILLVAGTCAAYAQDRRITLSARANTFVFLPYNRNTLDKTYETFSRGVSAEAHYFLRRYIGFGVFYSQSIEDGSNVYFIPAYTYQNERYEIAEEVAPFRYVFTGVSIQLSANKQKLFAPYASVKIGMMEIVEDFPDYTIANKSTVVSTGCGLNLRLSDWLAFNVFHADFVWLGKDFNLTGELPEYAVQIESGLTLKLFYKKVKVK